MNTILPIAIIIGSIWLFFGYTSPTYSGVTGSSNNEGKSIVELKSEEAEYLNALDKATQVAKVRDDLLAKLSTLKKDDSNKLIKLIPDHIDSVRLIIDINNVAAKYGMSLSNIVLSAPGADETKPSQVSSPNPTDGGAPSPVNESDMNALSQGLGPDNNLYDSIKLSFNVSGSYGNFIKFLGELQQSLRIVDITAVSFGLPETSSATNHSLSATTKTKDILIDSFNYSISIKTYYLK
jgi:Tfp pilus assembly protein PilO